MSDLNAQFAQAQIDVKTLTALPSNQALLNLYALFKQSTEGDVHGAKPGFTDIKGKYKYEAWGALKGTSQDGAKQKYIDYVKALLDGSAS
jgi:acyl-CoA-binding protein